MEGPPRRRHRPCRSPSTAGSRAGSSLPAQAAPSGLHLSLDGPYRWSLGLGLVVLAVVLRWPSERRTMVSIRILAQRLDPPDHRNSPDRSRRRRLSRRFWAVGGLVGIGVVDGGRRRNVAGGPHGRTKTVTAAPRRRGVHLFFAATCGLAAGPWKSPTSCNGFDLGRVQASHWLRSPSRCGARFSTETCRPSDRRNSARSAAPRQGFRVFPLDPPPNAAPGPPRTRSSPPQYPPTARP